MICKNCFYQNPDGNKFCTGCGSPLISQQEETPGIKKPAASNKEYKCPGCASSLSYSPEIKSLVCKSCGNHYTVSQYERIRYKKAAEDGSVDTSEYDEQIRQLAGKDKPFSWGEYRKNLSGEYISGTKVYVCHSCGATLEVSSQTAATKCPYCDNNVVISDTISSGLKPNLIIPFEIKPGDLYEKVKKYYSKKLFIPKDFFNKSRLDNVQGVYVPFWNFDSTVSGNISFTGTTTSKYRQGDYDCVETTTWLVRKSGSLSFRDIPIDGSETAPDDLMDSIQPYDMSKAQPFNDGYLSGFVAERFDRDPDESLPRAEEMMLRDTTSAFMKGENDLRDIKLATKQLDLINPDVRYCMLPVYLFDIKYGRRTYRFAMNGQTGKITGDVPSDERKIKLAKIIIPAAAAAAAYIIACLTYLF